MAVRRSGRSSIRQIAGIARVVLSHRELWGTALVQGRTMIPRRWWARSPRLPIPDPDYLAFRMVTAYGGDGSATADPSDVIAYLRWCRAFPRNLAR